MAGASLTMKIAGGVLTLGAVVGMAFGAYFTMTDAVGGEAKTRDLQVQQLRLQDTADDLDFEIWKVVHAMEVIETRQANGIRYHGDDRRMAALQRQLDILLNKQDAILIRLESQIK